MKRIVNSIIIIFFSLTTYGQTSSWEFGTNKIYTSPSTTTKVGIGTESPLYWLDVLNNAESSGEKLFRLMVSDSPDYFQIANGTGTSSQFIPNINAFRSSDNRQVMFVIGSVSDDMDNGTRPIVTFDARRESSAIQNRPLFSWASYGNTKMTMLSDGKLGIGTTTPYYELDVEGTIRAHKIIANLNTGADFVFEEDYNLMPLNELETFVKTKKHLPEVAPAKKMEAEGLSLSEMNIKLLQKIEELTLYTIEQQKSIDKLLEKVEKQDKVIERLVTKTR